MTNEKRISLGEDDLKLMKELGCGRRSRGPLGRQNGRGHCSREAMLRESKNGPIKVSE